MGDSQTSIIVMKVFLLLWLAFVSHAQATGLLNSKERRALIGHLQDVRSDKIVLTDRQKLALRQEMEFQKQGFSPFSPRTDPGFETGKVPEKTKRIIEIPRQSERLPSQTFVNSEKS